MTQQTAPDTAIVGARAFLATLPEGSDLKEAVRHIENLATECERLRDLAGNQQNQEGVTE